MRIARTFTLAALALALSLGSTTLGQEVEQEVSSDLDQSDHSSSHDESKHLSCQALCLADGEDPLDC